MPHEYIRFLQCQHLYGGITPDEYDAIPNERLSLDWWFYVTTNKYTNEKSKKKKGKNVPTKTLTLNEFMGAKDKEAE